MGFWEAIVVIVVISVVGDTVAKIAKARHGGSKLSSGELDEMQRQLEDQAAALSDAQAQMSDQNAQMEDLYERVEFAERLLLQARDQREIGSGPTEHQS